MCLFKIIIVPIHRLKTHHNFLCACNCHKYGFYTVPSCVIFVGPVKVGKCTLLIRHDTSKWTKLLGGCYIK